MRDFYEGFLEILLSAVIWIALILCFIVGFAGLGIGSIVLTGLLGSVGLGLWGILIIPVGIFLAILLCYLGYWLGDNYTDW